LLFFIAAVLFSACGNKADKAANDQPLAKVYDKTLSTAEITGNLPDGISAQDSALLVRAFVQRWIDDQLLMYEAERNIPKDLNIDKLVRDYRASLVRFNYEEQIIASKLDSTVSEQEVRRYYEDNKDQFQLESTILKCQLLKVPSNAPQNELNKLWNSHNATDGPKLAAFANQWAVLTLLNREKWYKLDEVAAILPKGTLTSDNVSSRREGTVSDGDFRYYYRVIESVRGKETAPFDYVQEQASKVILHHRKQELLEKWKKENFDAELRRGNVKLF
jgi:hypothetical protein